MTTGTYQICNVSRITFDREDCSTITMDFSPPSNARVERAGELLRVSFPDRPGIDFVMMARGVSQTPIGSVGYLWWKRPVHEVTVEGVQSFSPVSE